MNQVPYKMLSDDEVYQIHLAATRLLREVGVCVHLPAAQKLLTDAGCLVGEKDRFRIPTKLVEECAAMAPETFTLYGRDPSYKAVMEGTRVNIQPMIGRLNIFDLETGLRRRTNLQDVGNLVKIADSLPYYNTLHSGSIMPHIEGVPDAVAHVNGYITCVRNSSKVNKGCCRGSKVAKDILKMAEIVAGGSKEMAQKPNVFTTVNLISPLEYDDVMLEGLIEYAKRGMPVDVASEPQMGATSPVTLAGTLAQQTAEMLGALVMAQLVNPGTPVIMGTVGASMDMSNGTIALGGIEAGMLNAAHAQICRFYKVPSRGTGSNTETKLLDYQAGVEKALTMALPLWSGVNMIFYPGTMDHAKTISMESLLLDHELISMCFHAMRGIAVNDNTLAVDIIEKVGPGRHFLTEKHTMLNLGSEHFVPKYFDRGDYEGWLSKGSKTITDVAREEVKRILSTHQVKPLPEACEKELADYVKSVEKRELG